MAKHSKSDDETRDAILKRMLETPHKPHEPIGKPKKKQLRKLPKSKA